MIPAAKEAGADDCGCSNFAVSADAGGSSEAIIQHPTTDSIYYRSREYNIPALGKKSRNSWGLALFTGAAGMGFDVPKNREIGEQSRAASEENDSVRGERDLERLGRQMSEASLCATEEEEEEETEEGKMFDLGPQYTIKEQLEKDKDDESLRRWKEQLLGSVDLNNVGESLEPEVKIISLALLSPGRPDLLLSVPEGGKPKGLWFTLKEGSRYRLRFTFQVCGNIVSGLKYTNAVWKTGVKVYNTKEMLGTFSPQDEPYVYEMPEETTPSGIFARGSYTSRSKFVDDDNKCYLEINYTFDIRKEWATP